MSGFEFRETMAGSYHLLSAPDDERPMSFTIRAKARSILSFLRRPEVEIDGEVDAEGFADHRRLSGTLGIDVVRTGTLPYSFRFTSNDGKPYVFSGKKTLSARELAHSITMLPGSLYDEAGAEIGRALLRFDMRSDLLKFLTSFRVGAR
jgi:hypothetical protein